MSKHWIATDPTLIELCAQLAQQRQDLGLGMVKLSRKYGASLKQWKLTRDMSGNLVPVGFYFKKEPEWKQFKKGARDQKGRRPGFYEPRLNTKAGKAIAAKLEALATTAMAEIVKFIGMQQFGANGNLRRPGFDDHNGQYYLSLPDDVEPKGCERVSDVEMEKLLAA